MEQLERRLAQMHADEADLQLLTSSTNTLDGLFLLCTIGEFNAGKSSLINALIGDVHCRVGVLPTTSVVTLLRHASDEGLRGDAAASSAGVVAESVPAAGWLRDVSIVDTPGTNSLDARHTALTEEFVPRADLLLFVTSAERPYSDSEQRFLQSITRWGKKLVFVVNKADLLATPDELSEVTGHVAANAATALGERVPVLPVASRTALRLKQRASAESHASSDGGTREGDATAPAPPLPLGTDLAPFAADDSERLAAAQWAALEHHVLQVLRSDERAVAKLESQLALGRAVLAKYEEAERAERALVAGDLDALDEARRRLEVWARDTTGEFDAQRARLSLVLFGLEQRGVAFLDAELQLAMLPRLVRKGDFVERFKHIVLADAEAELQRVSVAVAGWLDAKGAAQSRATAELLTARLSPRSAGAGGASASGRDAGAGGRGAVGGAEATGANYYAQRQQLLLGLQQSARQTMDRFDATLAAERMATAAQTSLSTAALLGTGAIGVTSLATFKAASGLAAVDLTGLLPAALLASGLAATGLGLLPMRRYQLQREYRHKVGELQAQLDATVGRHLEEELHTSRHRAAELIAPFATLVGSAQAAQQERAGSLAESRRALDALRKEAKALAAGGGSGL